MRNKVLPLLLVILAFGFSIGSVSFIMKNVQKSRMPMLCQLVSDKSSLPYSVTLSRSTNETLKSVMKSGTGLIIPHFENGKCFVKYGFVSSELKTEDVSEMYSVVR